MIVEKNHIVPVENGTINCEISSHFRLLKLQVPNHVFGGVNPFKTKFFGDLYSLRLFLML